MRALRRLGGELIFEISEGMNNGITDYEIAFRA